MLTLIGRAIQFKGDSRITVLPERYIEPMKARLDVSKARRTINIYTGEPVYVIDSPCEPCIDFYDVSESLCESCPLGAFLDIGCAMLLEEKISVIKPHSLSFARTDVRWVIDAESSMEEVEAYFAAFRDAIDALPKVYAVNDAKEPHAVTIRNLKRRPYAVDESPDEKLI